MTKLSLLNLDRFSRDITRPTWPRAAMAAGILHIGVGNFHRAHMAGYLDELMHQGEARDWAIVGAGVAPYDSLMRERLMGQDYLTTVVERDAGVEKARVIGPMIDFISPQDRAALISRASDPAILIVSLTVTEGGYFLDANGHFDATHPEMISDGTHTDDPHTAFGLILAALKRRKMQGKKPFTVLSCDNLPHNGDVTRHVVVGLARLADSAFADWIEANVAFPNSMVDRIAPAIGEAERAYVAQKFGIDDAAPVICEPFRQWVIEDCFPAGRPAFERVGVTFVEDVMPFELMKLRMLNGGHASIAYPAALMDIVYVHEAMQHPLIERWFQTLQKREIMPQVPPVPGMDLDDYRASLTHRFANPKLGDTVRRLALDGSNRQPKFIIPTLASALAAGGPMEGLALESAFWCRYCRGTTQSGVVIEPNDPSWSRLVKVARAAQDQPELWLDMVDIYGEFGKHPRLRAAFAQALRAIDTTGVEATLIAYCH